TTPRGQALTAAGFAGASGLERAGQLPLQAVLAADPAGQVDHHLADQAPVAAPAQAEADVAAPGHAVGLVADPVPPGGGADRQVGGRALHMVEDGPGARRLPAPVRVDEHQPALVPDEIGAAMQAVRAR